MWKKIFGGNTDSSPANNNIESKTENIDEKNLPRHVAVIMDGNGRWANAQGLARTVGHKAGVGTLKNILKAADDWGISALTVYAFSTENWKRPAGEVDFLMSLFSEYLQKELREMHERGVRIRFIGKTKDFSPKLKKQMEEAENLTRSNPGIHFNVAVNYGGRDEITRAAKGIAQDVKSGKISLEALDEKLFEDYLDTKGDPPVDLMIRTGGDMRLSNFLLWQSAYAEFWFTDVGWPDFTPEIFRLAVEDFAKRDRRFGGV